MSFKNPLSVASSARAEKLKPDGFLMQRKRNAGDCEREREETTQARKIFCAAIKALQKAYWKRMCDTLTVKYGERATK